MNRLNVVLAVIVLLILSHACHAADLQAGWYVKIQGIDLYTYDPNWQYPNLQTGGYFYDTPSGQYGPFDVNGGTPSRDYRRYIFVLADAYGASSSDSLMLPVSFGTTSGELIAYFSMGVETNYDSACMYLDLWRTRTDGTQELLWTQQSSGSSLWSGHLANDIVAEGPFFFKLNVVPEPSSLIAVVLGFGIVCGRFSRRKRR